MVDKLYLTENIFSLDNKLYYEKDEKVQEVKNHNWHRMLNNYGWEKLNKQWIKNLNSYLKKPSNNSLYGCLDCGGDGECLFHCINYAINGDNDPSFLRKGLSESITKEKYELMIEFYQIMKGFNEFEEDWDPNKISYKEFKEKVKEGGNQYWGDFLLLNLLKEYLNVNLIMLNSNDHTNEYYYYPLFYEYDETIQTIVLLYENGNHFKLIGHFQDGNMICLFTKDTMPCELLKLINVLR